MRKKEYNDYFEPFIDEMIENFKKPNNENFNIVVNMCGGLYTESGIFSEKPWGPNEVKSVETGFLNNEKYLEYGFDMGISDSYRFIKNKWIETPSKYFESCLKRTSHRVIATHVSDYDHYPTFNDLYEVTFYNDYKLDLKEVSKYMIENGVSIISLIEKYQSLKVDKANYKISNDDMAKVQSFLKTALEVEVNNVINLFQDGKISQAKFDKYMDKYNEAKKAVLTINTNWKQQEATRQEIDKQVKEVEAEKERKQAEKQEKADEKADEKAKVKEAKQKAREALKEHREAEKERKAQEAREQRKAHIAEKTNNKEM